MRACFEAGSVATGAALSVTSASPAYSEFRHDTPLLEYYRRNALALGRMFPDVTPEDERTAASTDMANVSLAVPSIQPLVSIGSGSTGQHQAEFAAFAVRPEADRALLDGGTAMAWTVIDVALDAGQRVRLTGG